MIAYYLQRFLLVDSTSLQSQSDFLYESSRIFLPVEDDFLSELEKYLFEPALSAVFLFMSFLEFDMLFFMLPASELVFFSRSLDSFFEPYPLLALVSLPNDFSFMLRCIFWFFFVPFIRTPLRRYSRP